MSAGDLLWYGYLAGCVITLLPIARFVHAHMLEGEGDPADIACAVLLALASSWMWPALAPGAWLYRVLRMDAEERR